MSASPKTIQIYLPGGDPRGIRIAEVTTRIVQVIEVPRSLLSDFLKMPESGQVAVYFLIAEAVEDDAPRVYVGQTGDLRARLAQHNAKKDFWQRALVLISKTNSLTQTHALFLEWYCLQAIQKAGRYAGENGTAGTKPHTPAPMEADCLEIFDTGSTLLSTLGYPLFDAVAATGKTQQEELLFCKRTGVEGRGYYTSEGFVVLKGSTGHASLADYAKGTSSERYRLNLIKSGVLQVEGNRVVFAKDHLFGSPSMAAFALVGKAANGWLEWKNAAGKTLHALKRAEDGE